MASKNLAKSMTPENVPAATKGTSVANASKANAAKAHPAKANAAKADSAKGDAAAGKGSKDRAKNRTRAKTTAASKVATPDGQAKKLSALDAAAKVLAEMGEPMNCQELIKVMAAKGYWSSPAGKTPASTLYSALLRELSAKAEQARFQKTERGLFELRRA